MNFKNNLLVEKFIEYLVSKKNLSKNTCESYVNDINGFFSYQNDCNIDEISEKKIEYYIKNNPAMFSEIYEERDINNFYFDTIHLNSFHQKSISNMKVSFRFTSTDVLLLQIDD